MSGRMCRHARTGGGCRRAAGASAGGIPPGLGSVLVSVAADFVAGDRTAVQRAPGIPDVGRHEGHEERTQAIVRSVKRLDEELRIVSDDCMSASEG